MPDTSPHHLQELAADSNRGLLRRLRYSDGGNVMAIAAASLLPLMAMIGGGIDMSRLYLTKTRLQQACDAGSLAGRKSMVGLDFTTADKGTAEEFFRSNFPEGKYGTESVEVEYEASGAGAVTGTATVSVPMTLMTLFGQPEREISATCTADLQLPNTDVMFVLDTTLSMNQTNQGDSQSRIRVLRSSVTNFYDTLEGLKPAGSNIRYGFVPYSSTVNVGTLLRPDWIVDNAVYDSRVFDTVYQAPGSTQPGEIYDQTPPGEQIGLPVVTTDTSRSLENCVAPPNTRTQSSTCTPWVPATGVPRERTCTQVYTGNTYSASTAGGVCTITKAVWDGVIYKWLQRIIQNPDAGKPIPGGKYPHWIYRPVSYSMTSLKTASGAGTVTGGSLTAPVLLNSTGDGAANVTVNWGAANGCIEERATRRTNEGSGVPRLDMDVEMVPDRSKPETQWKPFLPALVYARIAYSPTDTNANWLYTNDPETRTILRGNTSNSSFFTYGNYSLYAACPRAARMLRAIPTQGELTTYLNGLNPNGFTYHDIGFVWGLRLMSPDGLFAAENRAAEATGRVARHLILMTDGNTETKLNAYDAWGVSAMDRRRTPTDAVPDDPTQNAITEDRLQELCTYAKDHMNITVWVIAFGDEFKDGGVAAVPPNLKNCASPGRAYAAADAPALNAAFAEIATQIAQLRITK
ncbi:MAG: hypothetical protein J7493_15460 [Porphyrobacter sp.]|nr:hypothetical protein [Porphyrobacter sp.]